MKGKIFLFVFALCWVGVPGFDSGGVVRAEDVGAGIITPGGGEGGFLLRDRQTVLFLGDSITANGTYISYADTFVRTRFPEWDVEMVPFGLSSETASGLSEPDHPFPRPCVHGRLDRVLQVVKPNITVVCYGMNDGIYYPFSEERFGAYKDGIGRLVKRLRAVGSKVILMTPPPFDGSQMSVNLQPDGAEEYSYKAVYEGYNAVLGRYAEWIMERSQADDVLVGVDLYAPMQEHIARQHNTEGNFKSGDGIHPAAGGHLMMAASLLEALGAPRVVASRELNLARAKEITLTRIPLPMPRDPAWDSYGLDLARLDKELNQFNIRVLGPSGKYAIKEGETEVGTLEIGASGQAVVNLSDLKELMANRQANAVLGLVNKRRGLIAKACSEQIGEFRAKGTLPEGKVTTIREILKREEIEKLENEIRERCVPSRIVLKFSAVESGN